MPSESLWDIESSFFFLMVIPSIEELYRVIGYCGRYGNQPASEILSHPVTRFPDLIKGIRYWRDKDKGNR